MMLKGVSAVKLISQAQRVHHGADTVQNGQTILSKLRNHLRIAAKSLRNRCRFANTRGLDDNIIEGSLRTQVMELLDQIHLQRAADTTVLQRHKTVIILAYYSALLDKRSIYIHFADIVDNHRKTDPFGVRQYAVQKCGLTAPEIAREQQDRYLINR